jgi:glycosyltransferase involved in cell wall biosynthesis
MAAHTEDKLPVRPWRVLHFVSTFAVKTDTKWLVQIARHLDRSRFALSAACFHEDGPIRQQLESLGVPTFNLQVPSERDPRAIVRARRLIVEQGCDAVHTHLLRADLLAGLAARWAGVPAIISTVYALGEYRREKRRRTDPLLDAVCAVLPTHAVAVADAIKRDCLKRLKMRGENITVIHTGIDPPPPVDPGRIDALRARWGLFPRHRLVLTLARLSYEKGVDVLVEAARLVRRTHPDVRFAVLGEGPDRPALEDRIRSANLDSVVRLAGFEADVWPAIWAAEVVCLPSKSEGMPNVLLEAMAAGKPIVASCVGGVPEAVESEINGLLVEPDEPASLAGAILRLVDDASLAQRLGKVARETAEARFSAKESVAAYARLYRRLLERRSVTDGSPVHGD